MQINADPARLDLQETRHLISALRAECAGDADAFEASFAAMRRGWDDDPLGALARVTLVSAMAANRVLDPDCPEQVELAWHVGLVGAQPVPQDLKVLAIEAVLQFAEAAGPNLVDVFGADPLTWRQAGAAMAAFTVGLIMIGGGASDAGPDRIIDSLFAPLTATWEAV